MDQVKDTKKNIKIIIGMVILGLGGKVCGLIRNMLMANQFGSTMETDAFLISWTGTILLTSLLAASISNSVVVVLNKIEDTDEYKLKVINNILNTVMVISFLLIAIFYAIAPIVIRVLSSGFEGEQYQLAIKLFRIGLPSVLIYNITGCLRGYLNFKDSFMEFGLVQYTLNITVILYILFFANTYGIDGLMVAQVFGVFLQLVVQLPFLKKTKFRYKFVFNIHDQNMKVLLAIMTPIFLGVAVNDINTIIDKTMASNLAVGSITSLEYGNTINNMFFAILIAPITRVMLPGMSRAFNHNKMGEVRKSYRNAFAFLFAFAIPVTVLLIILAKPIIAVIFGRGKFDEQAVMMTASAMTFYSIGLLAEAGNLINNKVYYSMNNTKTPLLFSLLGLFLNVVFNIILIQFMQLSGLALSTSLSSWIVFVIMRYKLKGKMKYDFAKEDKRIIAFSGIASAVMGISSACLYQFGLIGRTNDLFIVLIVGMFGLVLYSLFMFVGMKDEMRKLFSYFKKA